MNAVVLGLSPASHPIVFRALAAHRYRWTVYEDVPTFLKALDDEPDLVVVGGHNGASSARLARSRLGNARPMLAVVARNMSELPVADEYLFEPMDLREAMLRVGRMGESLLLPDIKRLAVAVAQLHAGALSLDHDRDSDAFMRASQEVQTQMKDLLSAAGMRAHRRTSWTG